MELGRGARVANDRGAKVKSSGLLPQNIQCVSIDDEPSVGNSGTNVEVDGGDSMNSDDMFDFEGVMKDLNPPSSRQQLNPPEDTQMQPKPASEPQSRTPRKRHPVVKFDPSPPPRKPRLRTIPVKPPNSASKGQSGNDGVGSPSQSSTPSTTSARSPNFFKKPTPPVPTRQTSTSGLSTSGGFNFSEISDPAPSDSCSHMNDEKWASCIDETRRATRKSLVSSFLNLIALSRINLPFMFDFQAFHSTVGAAETKAEVLCSVEPEVEELIMGEGELDDVSFVLQFCWQLHKVLVTLRFLLF